MSKIFFCILAERAVYDMSLEMAQRISWRAGKAGYTPLYVRYGRTDVTRQSIVNEFMKYAKGRDDCLVMLDIDHTHSPDVVERLAAHNVPVVAALTFRRGEPFEACAFRMGHDAKLHHLASFPPGLHRMDGLGTGAIAIRRHVFETLRADGHDWFFKYEYTDARTSPSEDMYFSKICRLAGVEMFVDTTLESPHITLGTIDSSVHADYVADHPDYAATLAPLTAPQVEVC